MQEQNKREQTSKTGDQRDFTLCLWHVLDSVFSSVFARTKKQRSGCFGSESSAPFVLMVNKKTLFSPPIHSASLSLSFERCGGTSFHERKTQRKEQEGKITGCGWFRTFLLMHDKKSPKKKKPLGSKWRRHELAQLLIANSLLGRIVDLASNNPALLHSLTTTLGVARLF